MKTTQALLTLLQKPKRLKALLSFGHKGYLAEIGWFKAFDSQQAVDAQGLAIPWVTYAFIDFIKDRLSADLSLFEYGSGNSTLFYAARVKQVYAVEHNEAWYQKILSSKPANVELIYSKLEKGGAYCQMANSQQEPFDVIIVDGRDRVNCCKQALTALTPRGVIVLDDSERTEYREAQDFLLQQGFKVIHFSGISPGLFYPKATSVFYKTENCLNI